MQFRVLSISCGLGLVLACGVAVSHAQSDSKPAHGRALELTEPTGKDAITNLNQLNGRSGLQQLEDELSKSLKPFTPRGSLDGVLAPAYVPPPQAPVVRSRKFKDELEKRRNWMFLSPDDMMPDMDEKDLMKLPEGFDTQKKKTPLEQFYDRLEREQKSYKVKNKQGDDPFGMRDRRDDSDSQDDSKLPGGIRDSAQGLKKLLNNESGSSSFTGQRSSSLSDLFGLSDKNALTKEDIEKHKAYMDEYKKVLSGPTPPMATTFDPFQAAATPAASPYNLNNLNPLPTTHSLPDTTLGTLGTITAPGLLPDPNAKALNQWNPFYNPVPKVDAPKPAPLNVSMPEAPRRRF